MNAIAMNIEAELAEELNVIDFPGQQKRSTVEELADLHRSQAATCKQRIADTKRELKARLASLSSTRKIAKARYESELALIAEQEAEEKAKAADAIARDEKLAAYNLGAVDLLAE